MPGGKLAIAAQLDIVGPPGSVEFGRTVTLLENGNFVVTDPNGPVSGIGAVYLYSSTGQLISTLTGSAFNDRVGIDGIVALPNGHFVVKSPQWDNGGATNAGAVTWVNGFTGLNGIVTAANSLVGSTSNDVVGAAPGVTVLASGDFVVAASSWSNGATVDAGAVLWVDGDTGRAGALTPSDALVGTTAGDHVGEGVVALRNGRYVVLSPAWDNGSAVNAGAVTLADGDGTTRGIVSPLNSLVGSLFADGVGDGGVTELANGHYVVGSPGWNNGVATAAGAVTWMDGTTGLVGPVSASNSLVGAKSGDAVGAGTPGLPFGPAIVALASGHYVVRSPKWDNGATADVGAATWCNGTTGRTGVVAPANSLIGGTAGDQIGSEGVYALTNGHYVVASGGWDNGSVVDAGAATWSNGTTGRVGTVSTSNSLYGTHADDLVTARGRIGVLTHGHYVVASPFWDNGAIVDAGAATWCNGIGGCVGAVSTINSLHGTSPQDRVALNGIVPLAGNGNYVVASPCWSNGGATCAGAVTWGSTAGGRQGAVSAANSLVGSNTNDYVGGSFGTVIGFLPNITALSNGDYVVASNAWNKPGASGAGAITHAPGSPGRIGAVSVANSLTGSVAGDNLGTGGVVGFVDGNYAVLSPGFNTPQAIDGGAATLARGALATTVGAANSVLGTVANNGSFKLAYDPVGERLFVGRPQSNRVSIFTLPGSGVFKNGFE
jgi:hypothetical protein